MTSTTPQGKSEPLISVVIPVYNSETYLSECLESVLKQDFKNLEIILIDDASTDSSSTICDSYSRKNQFIKSIHLEANLGASASRNTGIREATGQYIIFLDSDDLLFDGCLEGIAKLIQEQSYPDVIISRFITQRYDQRNEEGLSRDFSFDNSSIDDRNPDGVIAHIIDFSLLSPSCWRYAIKRISLITNDLFFVKTRIYEDLEYVCRLLCLVKKFRFYNNCLSWHRARSNGLAHSSIHSSNYDDSASYLQVACAICTFINRNTQLTDLKRAFLHTRLEATIKAFYACLLMHNAKETREFSNIIEHNMDHLRILKTGPNGIDFYTLIKKLGAYDGLASLAKFIKEQTLSLTRDFRKGELYVFCADIFGRAVARILLNEGYPVKGFLDNNSALTGSRLLDLNIYTPSILFSKSQHELSDIFVIVCHQQKYIFDRIASQLAEFGLEKKQIVHQFL